MTILMFGWEYPPHISGGLGTACYNLVNALAEKGVRVNFITPGPDESAGQVPGAGMHGHTKPIKVGNEQLVNVLSQLLRKITIPSELSPYGNKSISDEEERREERQKELDLAYQLEKELANFNASAAKALKGIEYDVIHAHDWPTYEAAMLMRNVSNKPVVLHVHSTEVDRNGDNGNEFIFELEKDGFLKADKIITVSQYTKNVLTDHYKVDSGKIEVVYHGVPQGFDNQITTDNLPRFKEKVVTFCGRITHQKGPIHFVNAAAKLTEMSDRIRFVMAGDGDLRHEMIELTAELGISRRFHFPGFLTREQVRYLWQISDVLVMPSVSEPFGLTGIEAMSAGVPVIVSSQSGLIELFPHVSQVDYWETDDLARLIFKLINDPQMTKQQKQENGRQLSKLSWEAAASQIVDLYHSVNPMV